MEKLIADISWINNLKECSKKSFVDGDSLDKFYNIIGYLLERSTETKDFIIKPVECSCFSYFFIEPDFNTSNYQLKQETSQVKPVQIDLFRQTLDDYLKSILMRDIPKQAINLLIGNQEVSKLVLFLNSYNIHKNEIYCSFILNKNVIINPEDINFM